MGKKVVASTPEITVTDHPTNMENSLWRDFLGGGVSEEEESSRRGAVIAPIAGGPALPSVGGAYVLQGESTRGAARGGGEIND